MTTPYKLAREEIGTWEWAEGHNPRVVAYFKDAGHPTVTDDETAWCAAFVGAMLERCGIRSTRSLAARSYLSWGSEVVGAPKAGDIAVFWRGSPSSWQGHVGFFVRRSGDRITVLGGNQRNQVNETEYPAAQLLGYRRTSGALEHSDPAEEDRPRGFIGALLDLLANMAGGRKRG